MVNIKTPVYCQEIVNTFEEKARFIPKTIFPKHTTYSCQADCSPREFREKKNLLLSKLLIPNEMLSQKYAFVSK